ncbi:MAG: beta-N-acetylhexosaminidase [Rickettsiales bacterium]|nr:beta-N-acetylhexosaminidase [Rickettsiales bacterium]
MTQAAFYGFEGTVLKPEEISFFKEADPLGFILFKRNCENPDQVRALTDSLRELTGKDQLPILIDQEGGRVTRLSPPAWEALPPAATFAASQNPERAMYLQGRVIAQQLADVGITINCTPIGDVPVPGSHDIIGDRAFGDTVEKVTKLARQHAEGLMAGGVLPTLKHIPGHGRAMVDSHESLPVVDASLAELEVSDFIPFRELSDIPLGMTAHIIYTALDGEVLSTFSPKVISYIREKIGFDGFLMSDDFSMKALTGTYRERAEKALAAGCDAVLHCNGKMDEMVAIAEGTGELTDKASQRMDRAWQELAQKSQYHDKVELVDIRDELAGILAA